MSESRKPRASIRNGTIKLTFWDPMVVIDRGQKPRDREKFFDYAFKRLEKMEADTSSDFVNEQISCFPGDLIKLRDLISEAEEKGLFDDENNEPVSRTRSSNARAETRGRTTRGSSRGDSDY